MAADRTADAPLVLECSRFTVRAFDMPAGNGATRRREFVVNPGAAVIVPVLDDGRIVLIRNHRFAVGETLWELPCGTMEPPEPPDVCAAREVAEETGYRAGRIEPLTSFYSCPGLCTELMHAFVAHDLEHVGQSLDDVEQIDAEAVALADAIEMIRDNRIRDGKTIAVLLYYWAFTRGA
jgi:ADP-ribose pyrophosphatase